MGGPSGHRTSRDHMRYVQHLLMFHHMPVRRASDNSIYSGSNLLYGGKDMTITGLADVSYCGWGQGKFAFTADGVDYTFQYLPPTLKDLNAPPELMAAQMDYVGVDRAVLQPAPAQPQGDAGRPGLLSILGLRAGYGHTRVLVRDTWDTGLRGVHGGTAGLRALA